MDRMTKLSTRQKGRLYEQLCAKKLERNGYIVYLVPPPMKFAPTIDMFKMFDVMAIRKQDKIKLFVQVKLNCKWITNEVRKLNKFKQDYLISSDLVQLWNYKQKNKRNKNSGWNIHDV